MPTFAEYQARSIAPGWLQDERGLAYLSAFGAQKDAIVARAKEAVKARFAGLAAPDALALIARERGIDRGLVESEASYRERVRSAWDSWRWAGTPFGLLLALYWAGFKPTDGKVTLQVQLGKQYQLRDDFDPAVHAPEEAVVTSQMPLPVHLGGAPELWNQFAVQISQPWPARWIGSAPVDGSDEQRTVASIVARWKPGHAKCVRLQVVSGPVWGSFTWGSFTWGAGTFVAWTPPAG